MNEHSNQQLRRALAAGTLSPRKHAVAKEVLRRRHHTAMGGTLWTYTWLPLVAVLGLMRRTARLQAEN